MSPFTKMSFLILLAPLITALPHLAARDAACNPPGTDFQVVAPCDDMTGKNYYIDPVFAHNYSIGYLTSGDFVSVSDFYEKCTGECAESGPIGKAYCHSAFMAYGKVDHAHGYPNDTYSPSWLCQLFNKELNFNNFVLSRDNGTWTNPAAYNNVC